MFSQRGEYGIAGSAARAAVVLLVSVCWPPALHAQQYLGALTGSVTDASGAKVAKAEVTATDVTTHFASKTVTDGAGEYSIPFLTPDTYSVSVTALGFGTETRTGIVLTAGGNVETDFSLKVATVGANVVVSAQTVQLDTGSANLGTTLSAQEVTETPNIGRNPFVLSTLAAGVTTGAYTQSKASGFTNPFSGTAVQIIANGSSGHNRLTLDGIPMIRQNAFPEPAIQASSPLLKRSRRLRHKPPSMMPSTGTGMVPCSTRSCAADPTNSMVGPTIFFRIPT